MTMYLLSIVVNQSIKIHGFLFFFLLLQPLQILRWALRRRCVKPTSAAMTCFTISAKKLQTSLWSAQTASSELELAKLVLGHASYIYKITGAREINFWCSSCKVMSGSRLDCDQWATKTTRISVKISYWAVATENVTSHTTSWSKTCGKKTSRKS